MRRPNLFIIGAPKCGTTTLASWLATHPKVFMSPEKEPHHFNTDIGNLSYIARSSYERLFRGADDRHSVVGEASTSYLYSRAAVPNILRYSPNARFIAMLRSPLEMAPSLHGQRLAAGHEHIAEFARAWAAELDRYRGREISRLCPHHWLLFYRRTSLLGEQLERLYGVVSIQRLLIILLDDLRVQPAKEYARTLRFLELPPDDRNDFPVANAAFAARIRMITTCRRALGLTRRRLGLPGLPPRLSSGLTAWNRRPAQRADLPHGLRQEMRAFFEDDVRKLERLLNRDLSHWLTAT